MRIRHLTTSLIAVLASVAAAGCGRASDPVHPSALDNGAVLDEERANVVLLCHVNDDGAYTLLEVARTTLESHRAHGDLRIGAPVPGDPNKILDENCAPVPRPLMITSGTWAMYLGGPPFQFDIHGEDFSAIGTWYTFTTGNPCFSLCSAGDPLDLDLTFVNESPVGFGVPAPVRGTLNGAFVEFGGSLLFDVSDDFRIPLPTPEQKVHPLKLTTPFRLSGTLKAWDGWSRFPPLVFERVVKADGLATLELLARDSTSFMFIRLTFDFAAQP